MTIRPCRHPQCGDGEPVITTLGMCEPCQHRTHKLLGWLVLDWVNLTVSLPTPIPRGDNARRSTQQEFGHPAEWASDTARQIADVLNSTHDALADTLGETPPPHPGITDRIRVNSAWNYLDPRIHVLAEQDWATDTIVELRELHGKIRSALGHTRPRQVLPTPCPHCELRTVTRTIDTGDVTCDACGWGIAGDNYAQYTRVVLDALIDFDSRKVGESA